jgi:signal transduction histidine kinase
MGQFLKPLEDLNQEISEVTAHKLTTQIPVRNSNDEIDVLAKSFNTMIGRLDDVFQSQKDFTASASHEIRTPITRMAFQLENLIKFESILLKLYHLYSRFKGMCISFLILPIHFCCLPNSTKKIFRAFTKK